MCDKTYLLRLLFRDFDIVAVITRPPSKAGRGQRISKTPVHTMADSHNLSVLVPEKANEPDFWSQLEALKPDLCITAAYGAYLPQKFLAIPKVGTLNIHPSLLPKYRGAAPVQRSLDNGDTEGGVTVLFSVKKMDAGPILRQEKILLRKEENAINVLNTLFSMGATLLGDALPELWNGRVSATEQDDSLATLAPKFSDADSELHLERMTAASVHNRCRALFGTQGVWMMIGIEKGSNPLQIRRIKIIETMVISEDSSNTALSGLDLNRELVAHKTVDGSGNRITVLKATCSDGSLVGISSLQPETKPIMSATSFLNGQVGNKLYWIPFEKDLADAAPLIQEEHSSFKQQL